MLHGWGANLGLVWPLAEKLAAAGYRVYVPDLPGFGKTALPPNTWTVHDYVAWVLAYMDAQGIERAHLFGHSFGGRLSIVLSAQHPARVEKVVLCDAAGVKPPTPWYRQLPVTLYKAVEGVVGDVGVIQKMRERYRAQVGSADYLQAGALKDTFLAVIAEDLLPFAPQITQPTLLVWGANDEDTPLWQANQLEAAIPDAGLVVFQGAGHYSYLDALPEATRVIDYFFSHNE
jgi:pimeloyl-ACP methyl ester carboxylesterase